MWTKLKRWFQDAIVWAIIGAITLFIIFWIAADIKRQFSIFFG